MGNLGVMQPDANTSLKKSLTSQTDKSKSSGKQSVNQTVDSQHRKMRSSHLKEQLARKTLNSTTKDEPLFGNQIQEPAEVIDTSVKAGRLTL